MDTWRPVIETLVRPEVAAALGGLIAFFLVKLLKLVRPGLSVEVKLAGAFAASVITACATEALTIAVDGSFDIGKVIAYLLSQWLVATLGNVAVEKPLKKQRLVREAEKATAGGTT